MMNKNRFIVGAAASLALVACEGPRESVQNVDVVTQIEFGNICASYARDASEARELERQIRLDGGNPNADSYYREVSQRARELLNQRFSIESQNPGINDYGECERNMVSALYSGGRL